MAYLHAWTSIFLQKTFSPSLTFLREPPSGSNAYIISELEMEMELELELELDWNCAIADNQASERLSPLLDDGCCFIEFILVKRTADGSFT